MWIRIRVRTRTMDTDPHRSWKRIQFGSGSTTLLFILHIQILHAISRGYLVVVTGINCWGTFWAGISIIRVYNAHIYCIYVYWPMWSIHRLRLSSWDTDILHKTLLGFTTMNMYSLLHKGTVLWDFYHIIFPSWNLNHQGPLVRVFSNLVPIEPSGPLIKSIF